MPLRKPALVVGFSMELDAGSVLPKMIAHARHRGFGAILAICSLVTASAVFAADNTPVGNCGLSPSDWCQSPPADPCGVHKDAVSCKADPACFGMPYRGESVVACHFDERGFAPNCPTVGCNSNATTQVI
jgi:hypothetical protein